MTNSMSLFAADSPILIVVLLAFAVFIIAGMWQMFSKAGEPGWACLVPIYNAVVLCRIGGKPEWWFLLMLIPIVGLIVAIIVWVGIAERFGKGVGFALGLVFLGFIFIPILGFGSAQYQGGPAS